MKKIIFILSFIILVSGCTATQDLAKTLRYSDNTPVGVKNIKFQELERMKRGEACTWNLLYFIPIQGDGSILSAASSAKINNVQLIGETGYWYFPFSKNCTVVFGDQLAQSEVMQGIGLD